MLQLQLGTDGGGLGQSAALAGRSSTADPFCGAQVDGITTPGSVLRTFLMLECALPGATLMIDFASYGTTPAGSCAGGFAPPSCDAVNSSSVVTALCEGKASCLIYPNSTTFGDPCFGVRKSIEVRAHCSEGGGTAKPGCDEGPCPHPAPPPIPPPAPVKAVVTVDWAESIGKLATTPSLQVVAHSLLMRDSAIHDKLFARLADMNASWVRYVPWLPTPLLGVAELEPPTATKTSWNFTLLDEQFLDVWNAVGGNDRTQIPNFSTPPTWLYSNTSWSYNSACTPTNGCLSGGYEKGSAPASAHGGLAALGDYYGRLLAWYTRGGMTDELGKRWESGHALNITLWEIYNEVDYEHGHTPETYTEEFDAIVKGIRKHADPNRTIEFAGMSLPNIDDTDKVVEWTKYFLNQSNHAPDARDALQYIGYHAYPTGVGSISNKNDLSKFFAYVDSFVDEKVAAVMGVVEKMSPNTKTLLDECGTTGPLFGGLTDPTYWVASGSYWAYLWARVAVSDFGHLIPVVGQSQFMDSPGREPGVTMMNWETGEGTAKYWITRMIIATATVGDPLYNAVSSAVGVFAMALSHEDVRRVILINKQNANATVEVTGAISATVVDEQTGELPPRTEQIADSITLGPYATAVITIAMV